MADQAAVSAEDVHAGTDRDRRNGNGKSPDAFRTISEAATELGLPQHVLRFWESKFPQIKPMKRGGGRRYYRPEDIVALRRIKDLLHVEGYTIKGAQKLLRDPAQRAALKSADGIDDTTDAGAEAEVTTAPVPPAPASDAASDAAADAAADAIDDAIDSLSALRDRMRAALG